MAGPGVAGWGGAQHGPCMWAESRGWARTMLPLLPVCRMHRPGASRQFHPAQAVPRVPLLHGKAGCSPVPALWLCCTRVVVAAALRCRQLHPAGQRAALLLVLLLPGSADDPVDAAGGAAFPAAHPASFQVPLLCCWCCWQHAAPACQTADRALHALVVPPPPAVSRAATAAPTGMPCRSAACHLHEGAAAAPPGSRGRV